MPYIKPEDYERAIAKPAVPGELNYSLSMSAAALFRGVPNLEEFEVEVNRKVDQYLTDNGISYTNYNNIIGCLSCCGWELQRRFKGTKLWLEAYAVADVLRGVAVDLYHERAIPYEDTKIAENGDVFPAELFEGEMT